LTTFWASYICSNSNKNRRYKRNWWVQKSDNKFSSKTAFLDTLRLSHIFGVKKATQKSFAGTTATLEVTFTGSAEMLADLISSTTFPELQVRIKAFAADQLQVEVQ